MDEKKFWEEYESLVIGLKAGALPPNSAIALAVDLGWRWAASGYYIKPLPSGKRVG